jgi:GNAT superfamily N-acetyltransferase
MSIFLQSSFEPSSEQQVHITGYSVGAIGRLTQLHARVYQERCGFDINFEVSVARELADFMANFDPEHDCIWLYKKWNAIIGCIAVDGSREETDGARIRFFIVDPQCQRQGIGRVLLRKAVDFCRANQMRRIALWTTADLPECRHLCEKLGFVVTDEVPYDAWGHTLVHLKLVLDLKEQSHRAKVTRKMVSSSYYGVV